MKALMRRLGLLAAIAGLVAWAGSASADIQINEIRIDNSGSDSDEYFELIGPPGASLAGLTYIVVGDSSAIMCSGVIECVVPLGGFSIQSDGLLCLRNSIPAVPAVLTGYDGMVPLTFENSDNLTHMLVSGFTGARGQDLDTNDDGVFDATPWTAVVDCIGLSTGVAPACPGTSERLYCGATVGPDGANVPGHVYRASDNLAWLIGAFSPLGTTDTPGAVNFSSLGPPAMYVDAMRDPCVPNAGQPVTVTMIVKNDPTRAELRYRVNDGAETAVEMEELGRVGGVATYFTQLPGQATNGTRVSYYCDAWNANATDPSRSYDDGYFVGTMTVAALRANDAAGSNLNRYYGARVRGRVTVPYGTLATANTEYYVQDGTGGIQVFKYGPHLVQPSLGDSVTIVGTVTQYSGNLELASTGSCDTVLVTIHGAGAPPAPRDITSCTLNEAVEGMLVRMRRLILVTGEDVTFVGNKEYEAVNCGDDTVSFYVDPETNVAGSAITGGYLDVVGIAGQWDTSPPYDWWYRITPRSTADLTVLDPTGVTPDASGPAPRLWPCTPTPFNRTAEIRYEVPAGPAGGDPVRVTLAVFDVHGREVTRLVDGPVPPGVHRATLDLSVFGSGGSGIYFYRLEAAGAVLTRKLIMVRGEESR
jgi:hypothetical protein